MRNTQRYESMSTKLRRIAEKAKQEPEVQFTSLAHLLDVEMLYDAFGRLRKGASPGIDGITAKAYEQNLKSNLEALHQKLREGSYRAQPVKRVYIDKDDGSKRALGLPALEDKVVQRAALTVLEAIYEQDFLPCSYGFRPGRNAHQALDAVKRAIVGGRVSYVLDADIKGYFDNIVREHLMDFIQHRIKDRSLLRLLSKWLHAGVIENGALLSMTQGTPQGATISPWMANVYLHYVLDRWIEEDVKPRMRGDVHLIRYADDLILCFQHRDDAERVYRVLPKRFAKYGLELHPEKTRLIPFGRFAAEQSQRDGQGKPATFDFLGFTHICGKSRDGKFMVKTKTARKRLRGAMKRITEWVGDHRHDPIGEQRVAINARLRGHYAYYGLRTNIASLHRMYRHTIHTWFMALRKRSQRRHVTWDAFNLILKRFPILKPRIQHRWEQLAF